MFNASKTERPLRRRLFKLLSQLVLGRKRAHYHNWLPTLQIRHRNVGHPGAVFYRGRGILDLSWGASFARCGTRIVIIGSGPSTADAPLQNIGPGEALLLNGAISLIGDRLSSPFAVAIEDERFVWRHFEMMRSRIGRDTPCFFSPAVLRAICDHEPGWLTGRAVALIDDIRKPYGHSRRSPVELEAFDFVRLDDNLTAGFSAAPEQGVFQGGSVAISALQFALATDAQTVGLIGVDISNACAPRFYERAGETAFSGIADAEARILAHVALAHKSAKAKGQSLLNHSPQSALQSIGLAYTPLANSAS